VAFKETHIFDVRTFGMIVDAPKPKAYGGLSRMSAPQEVIVEEKGSFECRDVFFRYDDDGGIFQCFARADVARREDAAALPRRNPQP
jgi:hypothetical protein